jgi:hypothetical protein
MLGRENSQRGLLDRLARAEFPSKGAASKGLTPVAEDDADIFPRKQGGAAGPASGPGAKGFAVSGHAARLANAMKKGGRN